MRTMRAKMIEKKRNQELINLLGLNHPLNRLARESGMRWCGHILSSDNDQALRRALDFQDVGKRESRRTNMTWKNK